MRWRVRFSTRHPLWYYASHTVFVDAACANEATVLVERTYTTSDTKAQAWACTPATERMEAQYQDLNRRREEWLRLAKTGQAYRGLL